MRMYVGLMTELNSSSTLIDGGQKIVPLLVCKVRLNNQDGALQIKNGLAGNLRGNSSVKEPL